MPIYKASLLRIDPKETRRYAGLHKARDFDERRIESACEEALLLIDPKAIYQIYDYDWQRQVISSDPPLAIESRQLGKHLALCDKVAVISVTIGEAIEEEASRLFEIGEYSASMLLDAAATTAVEQAADALEKVIARQTEKQGYSMRWRFSPGYGDWAIENQPALLHIIKGGEIGVHLSESLMLMPRKSITAIIGLYQEDRAQKDAAKQARAQIARG